MRGVSVVLDGEGGVMLTREERIAAARRALEWPADCGVTYIWGLDVVSPTAAARVLRQDASLSEHG